MFLTFTFTHLSNIYKDGDSTNSLSKYYPKQIQKMSSLNSDLLTTSFCVPFYCVLPLCHCKSRLMDEYSCAITTIAGSWKYESEAVLPDKE